MCCNSHNNIVKYNLLFDHTRYVLSKGLKICNSNMLSRSSESIFNPMRYTGYTIYACTIGCTHVLATLVKTNVQIVKFPMTFNDKIKSVEHLGTPHKKNTRGREIKLEITLVTVENNNNI